MIQPFPNSPRYCGEPCELLYGCGASCLSLAIMRYGSPLEDEALACFGKGSKRRVVLC